jgi:uncharacterized SAM-binding protein YcdF (DUF218 family)
MSRFRSFTSPRARRWGVSLALVAVTAWAGVVALGRMVAHEDPLQHADAIYVLGGTWASRWVEAVELRREGYAPLIVLSPDQLDLAQVQLEARGVHIPNPAEIARDIMVGHLQVPAAAVVILPNGVDNTAQEADAIRDLARQRQWRRLIVITDRASTRRAGFAFRRVFGAALNITMRAPRSDGYDPAHWWRTRQDVRQTFYETPKLIAYWLGLRG